MNILTTLFNWINLSNQPMTENDRKRKVHFSNTLPSKMRKSQSMSNLYSKSSNIYIQLDHIKNHYATSLFCTICDLPISDTQTTYVMCNTTFCYRCKPDVPHDNEDDDDL